MSTQEHYPFTVKPLPYPLGALSPFINSRTVFLHHDKHYAGYVNKLNTILSQYPQYQCLPLEALIIKYDVLPPDIRIGIKNNAGGVYNHELYFNCMTHPRKCRISPNFEKIINDNFGCLRNFYQEMKQAAESVFGSGYAYLAADMSGKMQIIKVKNQDTPLEQRLNPLLPIDVWEHAYYLQYQNRRDNYIDNWMKLINWNTVEKNYYL